MAEESDEQRQTRQEFRELEEWLESRRPLLTADLQGVP
jgi:hypothetical protein